MTSPLRKLCGVVGVLGAAGIFIFGGTVGPVSAHDSLLAASPEAGETTTSMTEVELTFSDNLLNVSGMSNAFAVQVIGPDDRYYTDGCVTLAGATITAPAALGGAGEYEVLWQVVSADGHAISESYVFDYAPSAGSAAAAGTDTAPVCGTASSTDVAAGGSDAPSTTAGASAADAADLGAGLTIGAAVIALTAAVTVFLVYRLRRSR